MNDKSQGRAAFYIALAGIFWSFSGVLGKFAPWNPFSLVGFRSVIAVLLLGKIRDSFRPKHTLWTWLGALGVAGTSVLFLCANKLTSSANAIVLQYAMTAIVILVQIFILRQKPRRIDIAAALLVMAGVALCFCQGMARGKLLGDALGLASAVTWALVFLAARMPGVDALSYAYQGNLLTCLLIFSLPFDAAIPGGGISGWLAAAAMGLFLGMGYFFFSCGMKTGLSPTVAAIIANIEPVINPIWVFLFLGETPGLMSVLGACLVLATVTVYSLRRDSA